MIYTPTNSKGLELVDEMGKPIYNAFSFNDKTKIAGIYLTNQKGQAVVNNKNTVKIKVKLSGARMVKAKLKT